MSESWRINRYLAACGLGSRRAVEKIIMAGRVTMDGQRVRGLGVQVVPGQRVEVDGRRVLPAPEHRVVLLNKPRRYLSTRDDPQGRRTIYDLLPHDYARLAHVGRLDYDSRGLLFLTNDGELLKRLTHPRYDHPKAYRVRLDQPLGRERADALRRGVDLEGEKPSRPAEVEGEGTDVHLVLREGKFRQVRRMMEALGREVLDLQRVAVGEFTLDGVEEGTWRELDAGEIARLRRSVGLEPETPPEW